MTEFTVDSILQKLLLLRNYPPETPSGLEERDVIFLCKSVRQIFLDQPTLLQLAPPLTVCGDLHGQFYDLLRIFDVAKYPPHTNYLFLGDYVDRGPQSVEIVALLFALKIKFPRNFFMLRGNHESAPMNQFYGFSQECAKKHSKKLWRTVNNVFDCLPIAAIINDTIFCVHGGISPKIKSMDDIESFTRPQEVPSQGLITDLLWSDPSSSPDISEWGPNERGTGVVFGQKVAKLFNQKFGFDLIIRAHQVLHDGFSFPFKDDKSVLTVYSATSDEDGVEQCGAFVSIDETLYCQFSVLKPLSKKKEEFVEI